MSWQQASLRGLFFRPGPILPALAWIWFLTTQPFQKLARPFECKRFIVLCVFPLVSKKGFGRSPKLNQVSRIIEAPICHPFMVEMLLHETKLWERPTLCLSSLKNARLIPLAMHYETHANETQCLARYAECDLHPDRRKHLEA